jgi:Polyprenyl synthetase
LKVDFFPPQQLVDDVLDYESVSATLGKPGGVDLSSGLATGPALYAWEEHPEMGILIQRKFKEAGDVEKVYFLEGQFLTHIFLPFRRRISFYVLQAYNAHAH